MFNNLPVNRMRGPVFDILLRILAKFVVHLWSGASGDTEILVSGTADSERAEDEKSVSAFLKQHIGRYKLYDP